MGLHCQNKLPLTLQQIIFHRQPITEYNQGSSCSIVSTMDIIQKMHLAETHSTYSIDLYSSMEQRSLNRELKTSVAPALTTASSVARLPVFPDKSR